MTKRLMTTRWVNLIAMLKASRHRLSTPRLATRAAALIFLPCTVSMAHASSAIEDVRLWRAPDHTRVVLDLSEAVEYSLLELKSPDRLVVDLTNTTLSQPLAALPIEGTPIARIRSGVRGGSDIRLVFDLSEAVQPKTFSLAPNERTGHRLVIDLFDHQTEVVETETVRSIEDLAEQRDIIVAVDAGHGGEDPGALGPGGLQEKRVVLSIAEKVRARLNQLNGFRAVLIRDGDYYVSLKGRRDLAREHQADLFVSIHADAFRLPSANGASVYALSTRGASSTAAQYLADRENAADLIGGVSLSDKDDVLAGVLTDLSMTATLDASLQIGAEVLEYVDDVARLHKNQVEQAGFAVLKSPDIPSILVETGFISNPGEARKLATAEYQDRMASAIERGVQRYFLAHPPPGTLLAFQREQSDRVHVVVRGDTLSAIAQRYGVSLSALKSTNALGSDQIRVGQSLKIPRTQG